MTTELDAPRRCALLVCELTSMVAPHETRARQIEERRAHLFDSACAGASATGELLAAFRGSVDDLRLGIDARRAAGLPPLRVAIFTESSASLVACAALLIVLLPLVFLIDTPLLAAVRPLMRAAQWMTIALASAVLFGGYATRMVRRRRSRRQESVPLR